MGTGYLFGWGWVGGGGGSATLSCPVAVDTPAGIPGHMAVAPWRRALPDLGDRPATVQGITPQMYAICPNLWINHTHTDTHKLFLRNLAVRGVQEGIEDWVRGQR